MVCVNFILSQLHAVLSGCDLKMMSGQKVKKKTKGKLGDRSYFSSLLQYRWSRLHASGSKQHVEALVASSWGFMLESPLLTHALGLITLLPSILEVMDTNSRPHRVRARQSPVPPTVGLISRLELIQEALYGIQLVCVEYLVLGPP